MVTPLLTQQGDRIDTEFSELEQLIQQIWRTMETANSCGLAAVQVGHPIQLFIVDSGAIYEEMRP